jgi:hypothetical protein
MSQDLVVVEFERGPCGEIAPPSVAGLSPKEALKAPAWSELGSRGQAGRGQVLPNSARSQR